jgi:hypothetical protein
MVKGITHILKNNAGVQTLIGQNVAGEKYKVYPVVCPTPEVPPYIVVKMTNRAPIDCKGSAPTTFIYSYDVYSFHPNYDTAVSIANAVEEALSLPDGVSANSVVFDDIRYTNRVDGYDEKYGVYAQISSFEAQVDES